MVSAPDGRQVAARHGADILGHRAGRRARDHRHVVGAVDRHRDQLAGRAVGRHRREAVGDRLAGAQLLDRRLAVVGRVGPVAGRIEREGAVGRRPSPGWAVKVDWPWSTSADGRARPTVVRLPPDRRRRPRSPTPVDAPPITGTSLVPWIVTVTSWLAVPSVDTAVKLSVIDWPAPSCWIAVWLSSAV